MTIHNLECRRCGGVQENAIVKNINRLPSCPECGGPTDFLWTTRTKYVASVAPRERTMVWLNKKTGKVAYPGRNDAPIPHRYSSVGYERVEFEHISELDKFCKERNLINEKAHYDRNGRADDL